jgi:hypothetical protein
VCCFSPLAQSGSFLDRLFARPARVHVAHTNIFARKLDGTTQALVYAMQLGATAEVAMILPLPVAPGAGEHAVEFRSLESHPEFFNTLAMLFHPPMPAANRGGPAFLSAPQARPPLPVHSVGAFEASFVPTLHDFDRLDARFRMPQSVWQEIGGYDDYGFAVFRLAPGKKANVHPMAFQFQTRDPSRLFFPTVHVHDGRVHQTAEFDHHLYYQGNVQDTDERAPMVVPAQAHALLARELPVCRRRLHGTLANRDTWISLADNA